MGKKIIQLLIAIILLIGLVTFGTRPIVADRQLKKLSGEILMDMTIPNKATNWAEVSRGSNKKLIFTAASQPNLEAKLLSIF